MHVVRLLVHVELSPELPLVEGIACGAVGAQQLAHDERLAQLKFRCHHPKCDDARSLRPGHGENS